MTAPLYFNSVERCIKQAYVNATLIAATGQVPSSEQYADGLNRLNDIANHWQTKGLKLMTWQDVVLTSLSTSTNYYPIGPGQSGISMTKPLRVVDAYYMQTSGAVTPITSVARNVWDNLPNKLSSPGQPINIFVDKQTSYLGVYLWPIPDPVSVANGAVHLVLQNQTTNTQSLTDNSILPIEWFRALSWELSTELVTGQPAEVVARCDMMANKFREDLEGWDVEDAQTFITVDTHGGMYNGDFT